MTLTGVGGVGKTRLSVQAAQNLSRSFKDGVRFVDLASLKDPDLVAAATCQSLNLWDQSRWTSASLADYLKDRRLLLVIDNCEHLIDACAALVETLLRAAPELRILATSRQPLGLIGEAVVRVPPLTIPADGVITRVQTAPQFEAMQLFVERASMAVPDFALDDTNVTIIAETCRRLDGIPLAIELVTARLRSMGLEQVVAGLDDRYRLLTGANRTAVARQQTLSALIEWSFDLCSAEEQILWRRLSVFSGSFDLEAAVIVCADGTLPTDRIPDVISSLVEKSILLPDAGSRPRYRLLDTIRDFGSERLRVETEVDVLHHRHRDYYKVLVETADAEWLSEHQVSWLNRLRQEHANIRAALGYCFEQSGGGEICLEMAGLLWTFWIAAGALGEGRRWIERGLAESDEAPSALRSRALWVVGYIAACQGDFDAAEKWLQQGRVAEKATHDEVAGAYLTLTEGLLAIFVGDDDRANTLLAAAKSRHHELGELKGFMDAQFLLSTLASVSGAVDRALELAHGTLSMSEQVGERWWRAWAERNLAVALWRADDREACGATIAQALRSCRELNERLCGALCLEVCSWRAAASGDHHRAAVLFGATTGVWESLSTSPFWQLADEDARWEHDTRGSLTTAAFDTAYAQGVQMTFEAALDYALNDRKQPGRSTTSEVRRDPSICALTPREVEVAEHVATGLNNQDIATTLVISRRTVESHVEHILTKLGFTSRGQIAAWVVGHRLTGSLR